MIYFFLQVFVGLLLFLGISILATSIVLFIVGFAKEITK